MYKVRVAFDKYVETKVEAQDLRRKLRIAIQAIIPDIWTENIYWEEVEPEPEKGSLE